VSKQPAKDFASVESRRSTSSARRMTKACFLFMIPKPFSRIVLAIGVPYEIPADAPLDDLERHRLIVQEAVMSLMRESKETLRETAV